jgi:hypothetical protein
MTWHPTITPCERAQAGWCESHHCWKLLAMHLQCRRQLKAYQAWEEGRGPCLQEPPASLPETAFAEAGAAATLDQDATAGPSLARRAVNLGRAVVRHVADRGQKVSDDLYEARLSACRACSLCDTKRLVCLHKSCGCFLTVKARWQSEDCPLQKWTPIRSESSDTPDLSVP